MRIEKKVQGKYYEKLLSGEKKFEVRLGDDNYKAGDTLVLREWDPKTEEYTGRMLEKEITYVFNSKKEEFGPWSEEDVKQYGLTILSLE